MIFLAPYADTPRESEAGVWVSNPGLALRSGEVTDRSASGLYLLESAWGGPTDGRR
jgi:hypothetical protein